MRDISYKFINKNKFFLPAFFTLFRNYLNTERYQMQKSRSMCITAAF